MVYGWASGLALTSGLVLTFGLVLALTFVQLALTWGLVAELV